ncbi:MAG: hypothetical protein ACI97A_004399 [Planctomycetota bacterium]|jgi:hypothetical protein
MIVCALLALLPSCATQDGINNSSVDVNPANAPVLNQIVPVQNEFVGQTAGVAATLTDLALEPIRFFFDVSNPGYVYPGQQTVVTVQSPEQRLATRRNYFGLPESAESRVAARQSLVRTRMQAQATAAQQQTR